MVLSVNDPGGRGEGSQVSTQSLSLYNVTQQVRVMVTTSWEFMKEVGVRRCLHVTAAKSAQPVVSAQAMLCPAFLEQTTGPPANADSDDRQSF